MNRGEQKPAVVFSGCVWQWPRRNFKRWYWASNSLNATGVARALSCRGLVEFTRIRQRLSGDRPLTEEGETGRKQLQCYRIAVSLEGPSHLAELS